MQTPLALDQGRVSKVIQARLRGAIGLSRSGPGGSVGDTGG
jgi:hypothetical protein